MNASDAQNTQLQSDSQSNIENTDMQLATDLSVSVNGIDNNIDEEGFNWQSTVDQKSMDASIFIKLEFKYSKRIKKWLVIGILMIITGVSGHYYLKDNVLKKYM